MNDYPIVTDENGVPRAPVPPSLVTVTRVVYALHALSILIGVFTGASIATAFVFGWPSIIAVIINYVERSDVRGTYLDSHFSWQIRCSADGLEKQAGNSNVESELGQSLADIKVDKADFRGKGSESDEKK